MSRRGAEVAVALARLNDTPLKVVYVSTTRDKGARRRRASLSLAPEEAILKDTAAAAARYDVEVKDDAARQHGAGGSNSPGNQFRAAPISSCSASTAFPVTNEFRQRRAGRSEQVEGSVLLFADGEAPQKGE